MSENPSETYDEKRINVKESWELNHWCDEFNLKAEELKEIVKKVGPEVHNVRVHLAKKFIGLGPVLY